LVRRKLTHKSDHKVYRDFLFYAYKQARAPFVGSAIADRIAAAYLIVECLAIQLIVDQLPFDLIDDQIRPV
jgi:hypothetical protein